MRLPTLWKRTKTAYDLLEQIKALIIAEPKRYDQGAWLVRSTDEDVEGMQFPACGTVGCVAGWATTLTVKRKLAPYEIASVAQRVLGLSAEQREELFDGAPVGLFAGVMPQTAAYAAAGVKHITAFQAKYEEQLRATKIRRPRTTRK